MLDIYNFIINKSIASDLIDLNYILKYKYEGL